jgi:hypothetical protein
VQRLVADNPTQHVTLLVCLSGIGETLNRATARNAGDRLPTEGIIALAVFIGPLGGLISLWILSHLLRLTGKWIGGIGNRVHLKTAIAWAAVPAVFALPLWIPELLLFGSDMFTSETPKLDAQPALGIVLVATGFAEITLGIWSLVLLCNTVAEVQGFRSAWRGLGNLVLAGLLLLIPLILLGIFLAVALRA